MSSPDRVARPTAAIAWSLCIAGLGGADPTAAELAQALQRKYETVRDFSADFVHSYRGGVLRTQLSERGRLAVKKPGRMRWEYTAPDEKVFVSDGARLYYYIPQDKQVIVASMPDDSRATTPALFLAGRGQIGRDFEAAFTDVPAGLSKEWKALQLTPKSPQRDFQSLTVVVDPASLALKGLAFIDAQGGTSTFSFTNLKENVGLADKTFDFKIPRGVDVVTDAPRP